MSEVPLYFVTSRWRPRRASTRPNERALVRVGQSYAELRGVKFLHMTSGLKRLGRVQEVAVREQSHSRRI